MEREIKVTNSSFVTRVMYIEDRTRDDGTTELYIEMQEERVYCYIVAPEDVTTFLRLAKETSFGKAYNSFIKRNFKGERV